MAKLSARGRTEIMRFERESITGLEARDINWERTSIAVMSDCTILKKYDVHFKPDQFKPSGYKHSYGWKHSAKLKEGFDHVRLQEFYEAKGYERQS